MTRVAALDCGTNTIRLLVADLNPQADGTVGLTDVTRRGEIVRLGKGVDRTGQFDPQALQLTLAATRTFAEECERLGVERARFVATSATRDAANRDEFIDGVRDILGIEPEVISGDEEATLSFKGSLVGAKGNRTRLVVDLGGGSTELVLGRTTPTAARSMDVGSVRITERYLADGVTPESEEAARADVRGLLDEAAQVVDLREAGDLIGLAGTITTVTAHALGLDAFIPERVDAAQLSTEQCLNSCEAILHSTPAQREAMGFLQPGRRDVIAAGALIWSEVIQRVVSETAGTDHPVTTTTTSLHDILDGIALSQA